MKRHLFINAGTGAVALVLSCLSAQSAGDAGSTNLNRFGLSYRMGFNISAKFKNVGAIPFYHGPAEMREYVRKEAEEVDALWNVR